MNMENLSLNSKQVQGLLQQDPWMQYIPLPRILDLIIQVLNKSEEEKAVPVDFIETLIPHLCFALPPVARNCTQLLKTLPQNSSVWHKLEEGLKDGKHLPVEVVAFLYESHPLTLEREMFRILAQYAEKVYHGDQGEEALYALVETTPETARGSAEYSYEEMEKETGSNFWSESAVIPAAVHSSSVFNICFQILCKICVDTKFSISFTLGSKDFFTQISKHNLKGELYELFPSSFQHIVYLLTMPTAVFRTSEHMKAIEDRLQEMLKESSNSHSLVHCLLCFFPHWLSLLTKREFFNLNLRKCQCFI
ncbi:uncharacterized protein LOC122254939 [Penaeus japonicus]|uniref:uncharacterized protein LOC122254939 n=1 Tax=Penaeus japonicus TaxID=27405 RepID=UPI001C70E6C2|nr:uncharacterized protein LOC122254939 [Penaeus japonicus]XP_042874744.1 uncharacterized protein LOC122254939 [Penaeus japonicus]XP_042874745.1 uncharacterized protein LOC122254939 [Penaeus japonicus]XP_042874746.1 uncharacterized protein LOC122254939 [Penaeus japonicus]XP_042874747.1 uncharacterized protein LOC122254939 [Penaeus japonicus]XP_042874749.1 uncharacterized protein LOC122254939 [Penaeus japonicus]